MERRRFGMRPGLDVMRAVLDQWERTNAEFGGDSDFTMIVQMIERRAGVTIAPAEKK